MSGRLAFAPMPQPVVTLSWGEGAGEPNESLSSTEMNRIVVRGLVTRTTVWPTGLR